MTLKDIWTGLVVWIKKMVTLHKKEILTFIDQMLDMAFQNLDKARMDKIDPAIRKKIANKLLADIIIMKIDITTEQGKSKVGHLVIDAIDWFTKEGE